MLLKEGNSTEAILFPLAKLFLWEKNVIKNYYIQIASKCLNI